MTSRTFAILRAIIDGDTSTLTADEAREIHAELWDRAGQVGRLTQERDDARSKAAALDAECSGLVHQVLAEERRAAVLTLALQDARELLRECVERKHNPKRARAEAAAFLLASGEKSG